MSDHNRPAPLVSAVGAHSLAEIISQPRFWKDCFGSMQAGRCVADIRSRVGEFSEWVFIGCGSSYYVALAAAATCSTVTGQRARAVPASELLLFPEVLQGAEKRVAVLISRSGRTSEMVRAAEVLQPDNNVFTLTVTGAVDGTLEKLTDAKLPLLPSDEESTVMTRSFTSMLLGLQDLAAAWAYDGALSTALRKLPAAAEPALKNLQPRIEEFVTARNFADYVCLGQGPYYGLACETALKITEMSSSYAQAFHTLEFRHGPKSIVGPETLVIFLLSEKGYEAECDVLEEIKSLGGTTIGIANRADHRARSCSDLLIEFGFELPKLARLSPYVFAGQLIGLYTGLKKGLDPDNPRHLSRVVILNQ